MPCDKSVPPSMPRRKHRDKMKSRGEHPNKHSLNHDFNYRQLNRFYSHLMECKCGVHAQDLPLQHHLKLHKEKAKRGYLCGPYRTATTGTNFAISIEAKQGLHDHHSYQNILNSICWKRKAKTWTMDWCGYGNLSMTRSSGKEREVGTDTGLKHAYMLSIAFVVLMSFSCVCK